MKKRSKKSKHPILVGVATVLGLGTVGLVGSAFVPFPATPWKRHAVWNFVGPGAAYFGAEKISKQNAGAIRVGAVISFVLQGLATGLSYSEAAQLPAATTTTTTAQK